MQKQKSQFESMKKTCPECGFQAIEETPVCPNCGFQWNQAKENELEPTSDSSVTPEEPQNKNDDIRWSDFKTSRSEKWRST